MPTRDRTLALPAAGDWRWEKGYLAAQTATYDEYPSLGGNTPDWKTNVVRWALGRIPDELSDALDAVDIAGLSYREAAEHLDVSHTTVGDRVTRGRELLRSELESVGWGTSSYNGSSEAADTESSNVANPTKKQGTEFETEVANDASSREGLFAERAPNALKARDVDIVLPDGSTVVVEAKHRQRLSIHKTLKEVVDGWADVGIPTVVWKRLEKKEGNVRRTPVGPTLMAFRLDDALDLLSDRARLQEARKRAKAAKRRKAVDIVDRIEDLLDREAEEEAGEGA